MKCWEEIIELIDGIQDDLEYIQDKINYHEVEFKSKYHESLSDENVEKIYKLLEEITKIV